MADLSPIKDNLLFALRMEESRAQKGLPGPDWEALTRERIASLTDDECREEIFRLGWGHLAIDWKPGETVRFQPGQTQDSALAIHEAIRQQEIAELSGKTLLEQLGET